MLHSCLVPIDFDRSDKHYIITIENNSDMDLFIFSELDHQDWAPDDSVWLSGEFYDESVIKAHSVDKEMFHMHTEHNLGGQSWDSQLDWEGHSYRIIAIDPEDARKGFGTQDNVPVLLSYEITLDAMDKLGWKVSFPLTRDSEVMRHWSAKEDPRFK